ncbi:hypothetical protein OK016_05050 [Vibrio chagasii]|nr:hypothetical protein [Vibrio chagasii]
MAIAGSPVMFAVRPCRSCRFQTVGTSAFDLTSCAAFRMMIMAQATKTNVAKCFRNTSYNGPSAVPFLQW